VDAAIIGEPTFLKVCPAQLGGHFAQMTFESSGGILLDGGERAEVVDQVREFLTGLREFGKERSRNAPKHKLYSHLSNPVPVLVTKIHTGPWGTREPVSIPDVCRIEVYWQALPGEDPEQVQNHFVSWLDDLVEQHPDVFRDRPGLEFPLRWLPGSALSESEPLVREFTRCAAAGLGEEPDVVGLEAPCDMYVFHEFGIPALLWGPGGGNTHASDEYLDLDSAVSAARVLLRFVCHWCGVR
jgi:acetylornithine deacetylase